MTTQAVLVWASHHLLNAAAICFGGGTLIMLYTYVNDCVLLSKGH